MKDNFSEQHLDFSFLSDDELNEKLIEIYTKTRNRDVLEINIGLISDYPGLRVLRDWTRSGFKEKFLDEEGFSKGMKSLIMMPLIEQGILI
jgi:hypothetical protein